MDFAWNCMAIIGLIVTLLTGVVITGLAICVMIAWWHDEVSEGTSIPSVTKEPLEPCEGPPRLPK